MQKIKHEDPADNTVTQQLRLLGCLERQQRRNEGGGARGAQFPGHQITAGGAKKSQQCHKYFLQQYICFRKTSCSNMGAPNLFLGPGAIRPRYAPDNESIAPSIDSAQHATVMMIIKDCQKRNWLAVITPHAAHARSVVYHDCGDNMTIISLLF